ncbi:MAG: UDP-N-acetylmuramoyl-L-alanine--D-glutamate ligase [Oligoflexia bacterium]|nr:UDP-N-acetylmuramoyl-L-alanine--D-glutamate ligase [Oligoflexia bacterium]
MKTQTQTQTQTQTNTKLPLFKQSKIAVHGLGVSGFKTLELLKLIKKNFIPSLEIWAINQGSIESWKKRDELKELLDEKYWLSEEDPHVPTLFASMDTIILAPGIPREHPLLQLALKKNISIWSEIELAYCFCHHPIPPIIAVTGSNGKTTTVTLIQDICINAGLNPFVGGNIGLPFSEYAIEEINNFKVKKSSKPFDIIILELSSFQLESIDSFKPNVAIITNISLTHTERYKSIEEYAHAKFNISKNMRKSDSDNDLIIYTTASSDVLLNEWASKQDAQLLKIDSKQISNIKNEMNKLFDLSTFKLIGDHNLLNLYSSYKALAHLEISSLKEKLINSVQMTINNFKAVHYRSEKIKINEKLPLSVYNDAKSTNLDATQKAIEAVATTAALTMASETTDIYLIFGGKKRSESAGKVWNEVFKSKIKKIFLIGETTDELADELQGKISFSKSYTLDNVIIEIKESLNKKNNKSKISLIFSPGYPSFDQFENYIKRGEYFEKIILDAFA